MVFSVKELGEEEPLPEGFGALHIAFIKRYCGEVCGFSVLCFLMSLFH